VNYIVYCKKGTVSQVRTPILKADSSFTERTGSELVETEALTLAIFVPVSMFSGTVTLLFAKSRLVPCEVSVISTEFSTMTICTFPCTCENKTRNFNIFATTQRNLLIKQSKKKG